MRRPGDPRLPGGHHQRPAVHAGRPGSVQREADHHREDRPAPAPAPGRSHRTPARWPAPTRPTTRPSARAACCGRTPSTSCSTSPAASRRQPLPQGERVAHRHQRRRPGHHGHRRRRAVRPEAGRASCGDHEELQGDAAPRRNVYNPVDVLGDAGRTATHSTWRPCLRIRVWTACWCLSEPAAHDSSS